MIYWIRFKISRDETASFSPSPVSHCTDISLLNNAFVLRMADHAARRIEKEAGAQADDQVVYAWQLAIQRAPDPRETQLSLDLVKKYGLASLCRALFNVNDFIIIE